MKIELRLMSALLFHACLLGFSSVQAQDIQAAAFLAGNWVEKRVEKTDRSETQEMWTQPRGELMAGVNTALRGSRGSFEYLRIVRRDGKLIYLASPGGRMPPTEFPLKEQGPNRLVFENPAHDFPTRILYTLKDDNLIARIEGTLGGNPRSMEWTFRRAP